MEAVAEAEEAQRRCDRIEGGESPLYRFGVLRRDDDRKEKGDINNGDDKVDVDGDGYGESLGIPTDDLSLWVDDVCDPLRGMPNRRVELIRSMSSRKIHMLSGSITAYLSSQGSWGIISGAVALFSDRTRSRMNIIGSRISSLGSDEAEKEKGW